MVKLVTLTMSETKFTNRFSFSEILNSYSETDWSASLSSAEFLDGDVNAAKKASIY